MVKKNTIFDSKSEIRIFKELKSKWTNFVEVFNHMPVANVIDIPQLKNFRSNEIRYLWKTSFDFVIASQQKQNYGEPLLIIEFDGIGQGYSLNDQYVQTKEIEYDQNRKWKMDVKLKAANVADIPLIVISDCEVNLLDNNYTILDGVIGSVLSMNEFRKRFHQESDILNERIKDIDNYEEIQSIVDVYGLDREIESKMKYNPIFSEATSLQYKLIENKIITGWGEKHGREGDKTFVTYSVKLSDGQELAETVGIRDVNCKDFSATVLVTEIAELLLLKRVASLYNIS